VAQERPSVATFGRTGALERRSIPMAWARTPVIPFMTVVPPEVAAFMPDVTKSIAGEAWSLSRDTRFLSGDTPFDS
jgi:hypothetical protein